MGVVLSLITAVLYGSADFCGGRASVRERVATVLLWAHLIGLVGVAALAAAVAEPIGWRDAGLGAAGGLFGLIGVGLFYRRLAIGPMHVVAPLSGVTAAATPALWGVVGGERLSTAAWTGIALALVAIVLVSIGSERSSAPVTAAVVAESLLSGIGFGAFFAFLSETTDEGAPWPVVCARITSVILLIGVALWTKRRHTSGSSTAGGDRQSFGFWALVAWAGLADTGANATFLYATQHGDLVVVSVLSSLYPLSTVVLARFVLGDRMTPGQFGGMAAALVGTALIVIGAA